MYGWVGGWVGGLNELLDFRREEGGWNDFCWTFIVWVGGWVGEWTYPAERSVGKERAVLLSRRGKTIRVEGVGCGEEVGKAVLDCRGRWVGELEEEEEVGGWVGGWVFLPEGETATTLPLGTV